MFSTAFHTAEETASAMKQAEELGVPTELVERDVLSDPVLRENPKDRCYHCKRNLFVVIDENNLFSGLLVMDDHREVIFKQELYDKVHVEDLMIEPEEFIYDDDTAAMVLEKFKRTGNFNMPVITRDRKYIGFVSKAKFLSEYQTFIADNSED